MDLSFKNTLFFNSTNYTPLLKRNPICPENGSISYFTFLFICSCVFDTSTHSLSLCWCHTLKKFNRLFYSRKTFFYALTLESTFILLTCHLCRCTTFDKTTFILFSMFFLFKNIALIASPFLPSGII